MSSARSMWINVWVFGVLLFLLPFWMLNDVDEIMDSGWVDTSFHFFLLLSWFLGLEYE